MDLPAAKEMFIKIMKDLPDTKKMTFLKWIDKEWNLRSVGNEEVPDGYASLLEIAGELRKKVPLSGVLPSENIYEPDNVPKEERDMRLHIDEFLYDEEILDKLVEEGKVSLHKCKDCGSNNVKRLTLISHSSSVERLRFLFTCLLPPLTNKTFLDVGSRLGPVLYGAYYYSTAKRIVGVEMNGELCKLVQSILERRQMLDRVEVVKADICMQSQLVSEADVILVSNAFEYFADTSIAIKCWKFIYQHVKPGAILVISPRAPVVFSQYDIGVAWTDWLSENELYDPEAGDIEDGANLIESMAAYTVLQPKPTLASNS